MNLKFVIRNTSLAAVLAVLATTQGAFAQGNPKADHYVIELKAGAEADSVLADHGLAATHLYRHALNGFAAQVSPGRLQALGNDPRVAKIVPDLQVFAFGKPTKPPQPPPSSQVVPAGVTRVGAKLVQRTGAGIGVAIVDTGVDFNHQDLLVSTEWSFVSPGFTYTTSAQDDEGHGTHVSGIVAARDNTVDVVGVAPGATLYAVKVLDNTGSGYDSDVISGLDAVAATVDPVTENSLLSIPIRVINMSLGRSASTADEDSPMHTAIQNVVAKGVTVVVAAGNDATAEISQMVPAGFPEVIAVGSTTAISGTSNNRRVAAIAADTASYFTTDGAGVAISAPGEEREDVQFPYINSVGILSTALGGGTIRMSGTSMAAPHATGVVALLLEKSPTLTPADVKTRIMTGDREGVAPLNSPASSYTFDGLREGILYAPAVLGN